MPAVTKEIPMSDPRDDGYITRQSMATMPPHNDDTVIRLALTCTDCGTLRVFEVNQALRNLSERHVAHLEVSTGCELCRRGVQVTLFWDSRDAGYAYTTLPIGDAMGVEDTLGLRAPVETPPEPQC
jgi:hypothetical protein